jgi:hypothetical protein
VAARNDCIADGGLDAFLKRLLEVVKAGFAGGCYGKASALKWLIALTHSIERKLSGTRCWRRR